MLMLTENTLKKAQNYLKINSQKHNANTYKNIQLKPSKIQL